MRLQWGRGFAATEGQNIGFPRKILLGFNGAVASQPRKGACLVSGYIRLDLPLQWGRGFAATEGCPQPSALLHVRCFNGAVASQPR